MEYTIPQELNREDRIGPFTIAQIIIIGIGMLIIGFLAIVGANVVVIIAAAIVLVPLMVFFMYKKYYTIPVYEFVVVYLVYIATPRLLIYRTDNLKDEFYEEERIKVILDEEDLLEMEEDD